MTLTLHRHVLRVLAVVLFVCFWVVFIGFLLLITSNTVAHRTGCSDAGGVIVNAPEGPICISHTVLIKVDK